MPALLREQDVGELTVRLRQRLPTESYYETEYSIQTFDGDQLVRVHDAYAYSDDIDYINRKWPLILEAVAHYV